MKEPIKFKTSNGYCHLTDDAIILNYDANSLEPSSALEGKAWIELVIVSFIIFLVISLIVWSIATKDYSKLIVYIILAISWINWPILRYLRLSNESNIKIARISEVKYRITKLGRKRAYFDVKFKDAKNRRKIRVIRMPRFENNASEEIKIGKEIFRQLGVLSED